MQLHFHHTQIRVLMILFLPLQIFYAELFRDVYITFRRDRCSRGGGVFICIKNYMDCRVLWTDEVFEMTAVEVKGRNPKFAWEVVWVYRAPNEDTRVIIVWYGKTVTVR